MARIDVTRAAELIAVVGSSGSGKSLWTKQRVRAAPRLLVWDTDDEYSAERCARITDLHHLWAVLLRATRGRFAFVPSSPRAQFEGWAKAALAWGECAAVAEEIADVTSPGKAPDGWGSLVRRGRKRGIAVYGVTQRPSESDKTLIGNATLIHCGRLQRAQDRAYMAAEMDCERALLDRLQNLEYVHKAAGSAGVQRGVVRIPSAKPREKARAERRASR